MRSGSLVRHPRSTLAVHRRLLVFGIVTLVFALLMSAVPHASAASVNSVAIADRYADGLDSRHSAARLAQATSSLGYSASSFTSGRSANKAFTDGGGAAVFGMFGHSNAGIFQIDENGANDQYLGAGLVTDVVSIDPAIRWWSEYLPFVEIDDMRLAIFAGCYTANAGSDFGQWTKVATEKGVDSTVSFPGLVYYPSNCTSCNYSGNYFWDRFSYYIQLGDTVSTALSKARSDLVAKEGTAGGWDRYIIRGSVGSPGSVRLKPAASGQSLTSQPFGIKPFTLSSLTPTATTETTEGGRELATVETAEGVTYRVADGGSTLVDLTAPVAATGAETINQEEARSVAEDFLGVHVSDFHRFRLVAHDDITHQDDDAISLFQWRLMVNGSPGPWLIDAEVDRYTGAVVYVNVIRTAFPASAPAIVADEAMAVARSVVADKRGEASATLDAWDGRWRWTVTLDRGLDGLVPDLDRLVIDATTGRLLARATA